MCTGRWISTNQQAFLQLWVSSGSLLGKPGPWAPAGGVRDVATPSDQLRIAAAGAGSRRLSRPVKSTLPATGSLSPRLLTFSRQICHMTSQSLLFAWSIKWQRCNDCLFVNNRKTRLDFRIHIVSVWKRCMMKNSHFLFESWVHFQRQNFTFPHYNSNVYVYELPLVLFLCYFSRSWNF